MPTKGLDASVGFPPIADARTHTLILGSLPSVASLAKQQYYGNPRNAFWRIMGELFGAGPDLPYAERTRRLLDAGIGVWDVLESSIRPGSMDANIDLESAKANDFDALLERCPAIRRICFNGRKAADLFRRVDCARAADCEFVAMPSTSPAFAAMVYADKLARWSAIRTSPGPGDDGARITR